MSLYLEKRKLANNEIKAKNKFHFEQETVAVIKAEWKMR